MCSVSCSCKDTEFLGTVELGVEQGAGVAAHILRVCYSNVHHNKGNNTLHSSGSRVSRIS